MAKIEIVMFDWKEAEEAQEKADSLIKKGYHIRQPNMGDDNIWIVYSKKPFTVTQAKKAIDKETPEESKDEWFKEVTIGHHLMPVAIRNLLKDKYGIKVKVTGDKYGETKILASVHTEKEKTQFEKFLDDVYSSNKVKGTAIYLYIKD